MIPTGQDRSRALIKILLKKPMSVRKNYQPAPGKRMGSQREFQLSSHNKLFLQSKLIFPMTTCKAKCPDVFSFILIKKDR